MKYYSTVFYSLLLLSVGIVFSNCKKDDPEPDPVRTFEDVENDFEAFNTSSGVHDVTLEFRLGEFWDFRFIAPEVQSGVSYPLIIDLHGASGGDANAHKHTDCYVEPGFENSEVFIISPNGGSFLWHHARNQEVVVQLTLMARKFWPIDADKIAVTGYSNGGNGSWFFGETQSELFSAAIPMASSYSTLATNGTVRTMPTPMYVIHGENDELFPVDSTAKWVALTQNAGSDIEFVTAAGLGHYEPCSYVSYLKDAVVWLEETVWK